MNKTVNINLGGMFFHIDEEAYQKLSKYFDAIKRSLSNSSGQDEIIKDIEMRVSELLTEKQKSEKHVVTTLEVDDVISVMGQPEDYRIDDEETTDKTSTFSTSKTKKLYRDKEKGLIGGVATGLGHYFGIDAVWLKIIFVILIPSATGIVAYIILWIVMPEATTTSEKLEMTGEPVTISSIEKKVREEYENVSSKLKKIEYDKFGNEVKTVAEKAGSSFGNLIIGILQVFSKFLGVLLILIGLVILAGLFIGVFTLGSSSFIDLPWQEFIEAGNYTDYPVWTFGLIMLFAVGIPFFFLTVLGFKLLSPSMKSMGNIAKYTLLAIWIIAVAIAISIVINQATASACDGRVIQKENINLKPSDTLNIKFIHNEYFARSINENDDFKIALDSSGNNVIYSNNVNFKIVKTDTNFAYIQIEKEANGKTLFEAKQRAEKINYDYKIIGNQLILNNYLLTNLSEKFRDQEVEIILYLPTETLFKVDSNVQDYDRTNEDYFSWDPENMNAVYKVGIDKINCQNCPIDYEDDTLESTELNDSIITKTVIIKEELSPNKNTNTKKSLTIDENGVIIKSN